jgi:hypothetical protein
MTMPHIHSHADALQPSRRSPRDPSRANGVVLFDRRFDARRISHRSRSNRTMRLLLSAAIIGAVSALSRDAPGPFVLLAVTTFMTAMSGVVFTS